MGDLKSAVHTVLLKYQREKGTRAAIEVAKNTLKRRVGTVCGIDEKTFHIEFNGEVCETVLEMLLMDYCREYPAETKDWYFNKGVILTDPASRSKEFLTEIDMLLMTPQCIYVFECKSYSGEKALRGNGVLTRNGGTGFDVYRQNLLHLEVLRKWMDRMSRRPAYLSVFFNFSNGSMIDYRDDLDRSRMPCVDETSLYSLFGWSRPAVWDPDVLKKLHSIFSSESDSLRKRHLNYVKSLHDSR